MSLAVEPRPLAGAVRPVRFAAGDFPDEPFSGEGFSGEDFDFVGLDLAMTGHLCLGIGPNASELPLVGCVKMAVP